LTAAAESLRAVVDAVESKPEPAMITLVIRLEGVVRRAAADLDKLAPAKSEDDAEASDELLRRYRGEPEGPADNE